MVKRINLVKILSVCMLGVLLTSSAFVQHASARSINPQEFLKSTANRSTESGSNVNKSKIVTQIDGGFNSEGKYYKNGIVSVLDADHLREGWNILNGDADKVVLYLNGSLVSGWYNDGVYWYYFDPVTHFMAINQPRVIDGKEYYFNYYGEMQYNCNIKGYYYGMSGAKEGFAKANTGQYINVKNYTKAFGNYSLDEFNTLIAQGKIKMKLAWYTGGAYGDNDITATPVLYNIDEN